MYIYIYIYIERERDTSIRCAVVQASPSENEWQKRGSLFTPFPVQNAYPF